MEHENYMQSDALDSMEKTPREYEVILGSIATNPETPGDILELLAKQASSYVLERVADNPNTPSVVLRELALHDCSDVRSAVADNPTAGGMMWILAADPSPDVRYHVAENPFAPIALLEMLCEDENPYVSTRASETLNRLKDKKGFVVSVIRFFNRREEARQLRRSQYKIS